MGAGGAILLLPDRISHGIFLGFLVLFSSPLLSTASIHEYKNGAFIPRSNSFFFHGGSEGLYASEGTLNSSSDGKSFIQFDSVTFRRTKESASNHHNMQSSTGLVEAIIVEIQDRDRIGGAYLNSEDICCTPQLYKEKSCKLGEVIIHPNPENAQWPKRIHTFFDGTNEETSMMTQNVPIEKTGMYYLYFMFCDPQLQGLTISGRTVWRNPGGYLPGKMAPLMTFHGFMSLAYLALGLIWFLRFVRFWKDTVQLHYHITAVIALGMCEMAFWFFEFTNFNATGSRPMVITIWAVTFTSVKKTVSRLLLLVVSMGYGVVRPTLGGITSRVILLGVLYFLASEALELVEHLGNINDFSGKARLFLVLPVALLDACFIVWIFSSLSKTLEKLQVGSCILFYVRKTVMFISAGFEPNRIQGEVIVHLPPLLCPRRYQDEFISGGFYPSEVTLRAHRGRVVWLRVGHGKESLAKNRAWKSSSPEVELVVKRFASSEYPL
ncbi:hypothetical protein KSP40_PGU009615 [Platanthera guangdongensis]|uniref:GOST seven transmembrane domain-containing protein n=1 Tax=Platanthera guangdongensis TaxID=2320717 RepID=A0ABR2MHM3_9ASPA